MAKSISIHAPRVGSDTSRKGTTTGSPISIHAPRVGSDSIPATAVRSCSDFNPRSPCGERQHHTQAHPLHKQFQSTLPVWGATWASGVPRMGI